MSVQGLTMAAQEDGETAGPATNARLAEIVREEGSLLTASLTRLTGDLGLAEDLVQDAVLAALERWPIDGIPANPAGWLFKTARNRGIDKLRREAAYREKLESLTHAPAPAEDDRLKLIFTCCHPALSREAQVALTLRVVCGLTVPEIARAFVTAEATIGQRLVRAKRKITDSGIPYRTPGPEELNDRLDQVLAVAYLMFNEGYLTSAGDTSHRADLVAEAEWLARVLSRLMPMEPEVMGLLALIRLHRARWGARFDAEGRLVLLRNQDRRLWDRDTIREAAELVVRASRMGRPGPYQIQAAIVACHAEATSWQETDWLQILLLYDALIGVAPSPIARLNRAIALSFVAGSDQALAEVESLEPELSSYRLFHATRAELLRNLGRAEDARRADEAALNLARNPAERTLLEQRLA